MLSLNKEESEDSNLPSGIHIGTVVCVSTRTCAHTHKHKYEWAVILVKSHSVHISGLSGHKCLHQLTNSATVATKAPWTVSKQVYIAHNFIHRSKLHQM